MSEHDGGNQFITRLRADYQAALAGIEINVRDLIKAGKEMRGVIAMNEYRAKILEVHKQLEVYYLAFSNNEKALSKFGSIRFQKWGKELVATSKVWEGASFKYDDQESLVLGVLSDQGYEHKHWCIDEILLVEVDYMLDVLDILIEPDFVPIIDSSDNEEEPDRHIASAVKIVVWRRDEGKCVQFGSRERLEYDHIIPVSKGGSNTERNVQLLCEVCNREKAAYIQ